MSKDAIDLIPFMVIIGLLLKLSLSIVMPIYNNSFDLKYDMIQDKTARKTDTYIEYATNTRDPGYSFDEMVLLIASQSQFMPDPKLIIIGSKVLVISSGDSSTLVRQGYEDPALTYVPNSAETMAFVSGIMEEWAEQFTAKHGSLKKVGPSGEDIPITVKDLRFALRFYPGENVNYADKKNDDHFVLCLVARERGNLRLNRYIRCLKDGDITLDAGHEKEFEEDFGSGYKPSSFVLLTNS